MKKIKLNFTVRIFNALVKVRIGNIEKLSKKYEPVLIPPYVAFHQAYDTHDLICFDKNRWEEDLVHECVDLAFSILRSRGIYNCRETEEVFTYLIDFLINYIKDNIE